MSVGRAVSGDAWIGCIQRPTDRRTEKHAALIIGKLDEEFP